MNLSKRPMLRANAALLWSTTACGTDWTGVARGSAAWCVLCGRTPGYCYTAALSFLHESKQLGIRRTHEALREGGFMKQDFKKVLENLYLSKTP